MLLGREASSAAPGVGKPGLTNLEKEWVVLCCLEDLGAAGLFREEGVAVSPSKLAFKDTATPSQYLHRHRLPHPLYSRVCEGERRKGPVPRPRVASFPALSAALKM